MTHSKKPIQYKLSSFLLLFFILEVALCQDKVLYFQQLSVEQGLSSSQFNWFVYQDARKMLWINSINGLNEFDGIRVDIHQALPDKAEALISPRASYSNYFETGDGRLWFTNVYAIISYHQDKGIFERHFLVDQRGDTIRPEYQWLYLDPETGNSFTRASHRIYAHNLPDASPAKMILADRFNYNTVTQKLSASKYRFIHHRSNNRYIKYHVYDQQWDEALLQDSTNTPDDSNVNNIFPLNDDQILVASKSNLWRLSREKALKWIPCNTSFGNRRVSDVVDMERLEFNQILLTTRSSGLYIYDLNEDRITSQIIAHQYGSNKPFQGSITHSYLDKQNNLWLSSASNGIWFANLNKIKFKAAFFDNYTANSQIISIAEGREKETFILTPTQLFEVKQDDTTIYNLPLRGDIVEKPTFVYQDCKNRVWVGSLTKLFVKLPNQKEFAVADILPEKSGQEIGWNSVHEITPGSLIFAPNRYSSILLQDDRSCWITPEVVRPFFVKSIDGSLFSATHKRELFIHSLDSLHAKADTLLELSAIATDIIPTNKEHTYYIPTFDGLYRLTQKDAAWHLEKDRRFPHLAVNSIHLDKMGFLWLASPRGLYRYHPEKESVWPFKEADGLQGPNFNFKAVLSHSDGRLFLGGTNGLNVFVPEEIKPSVPLPQPSISAVYINGTDEHLDQYNRGEFKNPQLITDLHLPFRDNHLKLHLSSMEYSDPKSCRFKYRLLGRKRDTSWIDHGNSTVLDFPNLSSGKFRLQFNATNSDGVWAVQPRSLNIQVDPPWYLSTWFLILSGCSLLICGFLIARRENRREREKEELRRKEAEAREQEEAARRLAAETETAVLRLQMDPHFIYNALNGVDDMIRQGKNEKASEYLYRISHLLRQILEQSEELSISLLEEKELLHLYLSAEQIRLGDRLRYEFLVQDGLDAEVEQIPTMILQPFVENAIWHGIAPKPQGGLVTVTFSQEHGVLRVEITDNGVGRSRAPKHLKKKYESKAISITQRRFDLIKETTGQSSSGFEIIDLFDPKGAPTGTRVLFTFPKV